ncbi:CAP domain-containing protein [Paraburkholderia sp. MMS20-SJTR3]|uniref:CAP domain-containing protein n=1 Tax=Paraburkholderia sejongensis TaxID=2886946 RepID=A0ABS8K5V3_9BURK|nr:CAP domain-containing protein [Paraburkholderia sp. MMS20-SJTR3]MCC8397258.1 CAP domain-containing protein [Paraburkholderia sp. MMS20-SJTR3]
MTIKSTFALTSAAVAASILVAACGGGGGGGGDTNSAGAATPASAATPSSAPAASTPTSANTSTPQYAANSAQLAVFNTINQQRQQCGLPALVENTQLDQAAQAHAAYMGQNGGTITDTEVASNPGFTGATYADRATHVGFPGSQVYIGGESAGYYTNATLTEAAYGQAIAYAWMGGVYHIAIASWPVTEIGLGWNETTVNGFPEIQASNSIANMQPLAGNLPLTFPCQGTTGVAYKTIGETPTPPNTSGAYGAPVSVVGNAADTIVLTSGTYTDSSGNVINLQLLNSSTDTNHELPAFEAVAYPVAPLNANTTYTVSLTGTRNGTAFSRTFAFTTGNVVG